VVRSSTLRIGLPQALCCAAAWALLAGAAGADFTAYNDCAGAGSPASVTAYGLGGSGALVNYATGAPAGAWVSVESYGVSYGVVDQACMPSLGTDAYAMFNGRVTMDSAVILPGTSGWYVRLVFGGLDPGSRYDFATTMNLGKASYANRWSVVSILGADAYEYAASGSALKVDSSSCSIAAYNTSSGFVAGWNAIAPGSDGQFVIHITCATSSNQYAPAFPQDGFRGAGPAGFMLREVAPCGGSHAWLSCIGSDWNAATNWSAGVPDGVGAQVALGNALQSAAMINLDIAPTVGAIKFDNANKYTIGGTYTLTLATSSGNASIQVDTGSHEIAAPVTLGSDLAANIAGDLLTISGPMDGPYGVTKTGAGKLEINGTATYTGTTHVVNGELSLGAAQTLGAVVIDSSALVTLVDGATQISSLEIAGGSSAPEAKLDIMSNALIIDYSGGSSPLAEIEALIIKGYNGGDWAGNGITSSVLFDITAEAIGVIDNTTFLGGGLGEFAGRSIGMETVLVRKVIAGDIDMSGEVNAADYFYIDFNLDTAGGGWGAGDLDYSGETNSADYFYIDFNLGMSEGASMGTSIPEPATLVLLTLGGLAVVRRRR
jgi:autotransporter-associated beta strand protein